MSTAMAVLTVAVLVAAAVRVLGPLGATRRTRRLGPAVPAVPRHPTGLAPAQRRAQWGRPGVRRRPSDRRLEPARRAAVVEVCRAVAAELRAGRPPEAALVLATEPLLAPGATAAPVQADLLALAAAGRGGAPVPGVLRALAARPGAEAAGALALCWEVAGQTGAGLAAAVQRVAEGAAADAALRRQLAAELAAPRATARLLAVLPLLGLLLGAGLGAHPLTVLLTTPLGLGCLSAGTVLTGSGAWWARRIVGSVLRP